MLFLVRHAHANYSRDEMRPLSDAGHLEAERLATVLEARDISSIVSSPYARAVQTVQPLADRLGLDIQLHPDLRERHLSAEPLDDFERWLELTWSDFGLALPGCESSEAAQARVKRTVWQIADAARGHNVVIASHGNAIALFLRTLDPTVDFAFWKRMTTPDVYVVDATPGAAWSFHRLREKS